MRSSRFALIFILALIFEYDAASADPPIFVAAAANLKPVLPTLVERFSDETGMNVRIVYGSSGKLASQILNGAPYEVFLSADQEFPAKIAAARLGHGSPQTYAIGILVACLRGKAPSPIAIANPRTAPYGRAAVQYLKRCWGVDENRANLVIGDSIGQAAQFFASGNVDRAFLAKSQVTGLECYGDPNIRFIELDTPQLDPIRQDLLLLKNNGGKPRKAAIDFVGFMLSQPAREILKASGYRLP